MGCRAEIRTRACLTASQRTTSWAKLHPPEPRCTLLSQAAPCTGIIDPLGLTPHLFNSDSDPVPTPIIVSPVLRVWTRTPRIRRFVDLVDPDPLVIGTDQKLVTFSVADPDPNPDPPDPHVLEPPGSGFGSSSQRYGSGSGSGSFYHQAKVVAVFWLLFDVLSLKNDVNVSTFKK